MRILPILILFAVSSLCLQAQPEPVAEWHFHPHFMLPGLAGEKPTSASGELPRAVQFRQSPALSWLEGEETHRLREPLTLPSEGAFSMELVVWHHVHRTVGFSMALSHPGDALPHLVAGYRDNRSALWLAEERASQASMTWPMAPGIQRYGHHFVLVRDSQGWHWYQQGEWLGSIPHSGPLPSGNQRLDLALHAEAEPEMQIGDLVRELRFYNQALTKDAIRDLEQQTRTRMAAGLTARRDFHFMAGPYLYGAGPDHIHLAVELNRPPQELWVNYGTDGRALETRTAPAQVLEGAGGSGIHHFRLSDLAPGGNYYYRVLARSPEGDTIQSRLLTFRTAIRNPAPFTFGIISDTESRPFINHQVALRLWHERPEFILHAGDLTDGGMAAQKIEWNWEYFAGMHAIAGRITVFPVPGNGEEDRHWYDRYHALLPEKPAYTFTWGEVDFFMLDSNRPEEFLPGGKQYTWLEKALRASRAKWKVVMHHHAPWSSDEDDYGNTWETPGLQGDPALRVLWPLYEEYGVDLLVYGHLHTYQRTHPIRGGEVHPLGVRGLQVGGAGGNLEDFAPHRSWFSARTYRGYHYVLVDVAEDRLVLRAFDLEGRLIDQEELRQSRRP